MRQGSPLLRFPRPHDRGRIEGRQRFRCRKLGSGGFHDPTVVAELKVDHPGGTDPGVPSFHDPTVVAELKGRGKRSAMR